MAANVLSGTAIQTPQHLMLCTTLHLLLNTPILLLLLSIPLLLLMMPTIAGHPDPVRMVDRHATPELFVLEGKRPREQARPLSDTRGVIAQGTRTA
ncbi:hypothetical protein BDR03DRAFT_1015729 [Suillus americanus]|nr:hypothetical protein BDR03DRAFT_1015729 [Suillus americanus]